MPSKKLQQLKAKGIMDAVKLQLCLNTLYYFNWFSLWFSFPFVRFTYGRDGCCHGQDKAEVSILNTPSVVYPSTAVQQRGHINTAVAPGLFIPSNLIQLF